MDPKPYSFLVLMDKFKEDNLLRLMVDMLQEIHDCCDDANGAAVKVEMALQRFLKRLDKPLPPGAFWPSES